MAAIQSQSTSDVFSATQRVSVAPHGASTELLSIDEVENLDMHLHGVAGGVLRRKLLPVLQRKKVMVARRLLTRQRQPWLHSPAFLVKHQLPHDVVAALKRAFLGSESQLQPQHVVDLQCILKKFPWDIVETTLAPHIRAVSYKTGDIVAFPETPAEGGSIHILLHGTLCLVKPADCSKPQLQMYLRRCALSSNFDAAKAALMHFPQMATLTAPCVYGLEEALDFAPQPEHTVFSGPLAHSMPSVADVLEIPNRAFQEILHNLSSLHIPAPVAEDSTAAARQPRAPERTTSRLVSAASRRLSKFASITGMTASAASSVADGGRKRSVAGLNPLLLHHDSAVNDSFSSKAPSTPGVLRGPKRELAQLVKLRRERCLQHHFPTTDVIIRMSWLMQALPQHAITELQKCMKPLFLPPNTRLATAGEVHRKWYFLQRGRCVILPSMQSRTMSPTTGSDGTVRRKSTLTASGAPAFVEAGSSFGELSLIFEEPRSHSMATVSSCDLWVLEQRAFGDILASDEALRVACQRRAAVLRGKWLAAQRRSLELKECLQNCALFKDCWSDVLYSMLVDAIEPLVLPQRTLIASASQFCDRLLIIVKGTASSQRGDVPITFGAGDIIGESCFVRHRWPFAIAATSIVDCWHLSSAKLHRIASRLDLIQTLSRWDPEAERGKYLTRLQEMTGGHFFPAETMSLLRRSILIGAKDLISNLPVTSSTFRKRGERSTGFASHFRKVSLDELEVLTITYPNSFTMNDLLFRTSYGRPDDHLRAQYLARRGKHCDRSASSSSSDGGTRRNSCSPQKRHQSSSAPPAAQDESALDLYSRRQKRAAFERSARKQIRRLVGEDVSDSNESSSSADDTQKSCGDSDDVLSPEERLKRYRANRQATKNHGVNSGVLSHVDDGSVMNSAQLAADQAVLKNIVRDQRRKERVNVSSANSLVMSTAMVFGHGTGDPPAFSASRSQSNSLAFSSFAFSGRQQSSASIYSDDDRASSVHSMDYGDKVNDANWMSKMALPRGAYEWEETLRALFSTGDDIIPNLRDMLRLLKVRSKKLRQRNRNAGTVGSPSTIASGTNSAAAALSKRAALSEFTPDDRLHCCVHPSDPEVTVGASDQQMLRHLVAVSSTERLGRMVAASNAIAAASATHQGSPGGGKDATEDAVVNERTKMLLQMFRSGYANKGSRTSKSASTAAALTPPETSLGESGVDASRRRQKLSVVNLIATEEASPDHDRSSLHDSTAPIFTPPKPSDTSAEGTPSQAFLVAAVSHHTSTPHVTFSASSDAAGARRKSLGGIGGRPQDAAARSLLLTADMFPSKALFFDHVAREVNNLITTSGAIAVVDSLQRKFDCSWLDEFDAEAHVKRVFDDYVKSMKKHAVESSRRAQYSTASRRSSQLVSAMHRRGTDVPKSPVIATSGSMASMEMGLDQTANSGSGAGGSGSCCETPLDTEPTTPRAETPVTPRSCSSPALSDNDWTEWDGYLHSSSESAKSTSSMVRRESRVQLRRQSSAKTISSNITAQTADAHSDPGAASAKTGAKGWAARGASKAIFDSGVRSAASDEVATSLKRFTDGLRSGERKPELEELFALAGDDAALSVWIDGVGAIVMNDPETLLSNQEVAAARRVLQSTVRSFDSVQTHQHHRQEHDHSSSGIPTSSIDVQSSQIHYPLGTERRFPDLRETQAIIRRMEQLADHVGLVDRDDCGMAGPDRIVAQAMDDLRAMTAKFSRRQNIEEDLPSAAQGSSKKHALPQSSRDAIDGNDAQHNPHSTIPWFFEKDAGGDYLEEALKETVPLVFNHKSSHAENGGDDDDDDEDESRERVVAVGSRMFNMNPRPLTRAHSPLLDADDNSETVVDGRLESAKETKSQLLAFSAFRSVDQPTAGDESLRQSLRPSDVGDSSYTPALSVRNDFLSNPDNMDASSSQRLPSKDVSTHDLLATLRRKSRRTHVVSKSTTAIESVYDMTPRSGGAVSQSRVDVVKRRHEKLMERVAQSAAKRRNSAAGENIPVSDRLNPLPLTPLTRNTAFVVLPH